ncbi:unnamed protein product [Pleuronectes platessa]|uniref:Uncharacterized protein n=1 Tax=Pleuronectes platessa TaxID=8262 RepID=A0A9N7YF63_PLEPL|nr:unnamed protein product [Pleuronectes platessa]
MSSSWKLQHVNNSGPGPVTVTGNNKELLGLHFLCRGVRRPHAGLEALSARYSTRTSRRDAEGRLPGDCASQPRSEQWTTICFPPSAELAPPSPSASTGLTGYSHRAGSSPTRWKHDAAAVPLHAGHSISNSGAVFTPSGRDCNGNICFSCDSYAFPTQGSGYAPERSALCGLDKAISRHSCSRMGVSCLQQHVRIAARSEEAERGGHAADHRHPPAAVRFPSQPLYGAFITGWTGEPQTAHCQWMSRCGSEPDPVLTGQGAAAGGVLVRGWLGSGRLWFGSVRLRRPILEEVEEGRQSAAVKGKKMEIV